MRHLRLYMYIRVPALVQDGGRDAPEPMSRHFILVSHSLERHTDRSVAHRRILWSLSRKEILALSRNRAQELKDLDCLMRQRNNVGKSVTLHSLLRYFPALTLKIDLRPLCKN